MNANSVLLRSSAAAWSRLGDEILIIDTAERRSHRLLDTAAFIWEHADGKRTLSDIAAALVAAYDVSQETAERDVLDMARRWQDAGIASTAP